MKTKFDRINLSKDDFEYNYNPRVAVPNAQEYIDDFIERSKTARTLMEGVYDIRYGSKPKQTLDLHLPKDSSNPPLLIYIHGGYWRAIDKNDHSFIALPFIKNGIAVANVNYDLCPSVTLTEIVDEIIEAFHFVRNQVKEWKTNGVYLIGHSAGAHLAGEIIGRIFFGREKDNSRLKGSILLSGIYEPEVVLHLDVNEDIRLDQEMAFKCNLINKPPLCESPIMICVGGDEPEGWIDQSRSYFELCDSQNIKVDFKIVEGTNHFSLLDHAMSEDYELNKKIIEFIENQQRLK